MRFWLPIPIVSMLLLCLDLGVPVFYYQGLLAPNPRVPMPISQLSRTQAEKEPHLVWNAFIELLTENDYADLSSEQQPAFLVFWYESEVQNGGHLQYFENRGTKHLDKTIAALGFLGAPCQQQVLEDAASLFLSREHSPISTADEYASIALLDEFGEFDRRFHDCSPSLNQCLERHLQEHQSWFVALT